MKRTRSRGGADDAAEDDEIAASALLGFAAAAGQRRPTPPQQQPLFAPATTTTTTQQRPLFAAVGNARGSLLLRGDVCARCGGGGGAGGAGTELAVCADCAECFHAFCCAAPQPPPVFRGPCAVTWRCAGCRVCAACGQRGGRVVACECCGACFHAECAPPPPMRPFDAPFAAESVPLCANCARRIDDVRGVRFQLPLFHPLLHADGALPPWLSCELVSQSRRTSRVRLRVQIRVAKQPQPQQQPTLPQQQPSGAEIEAASALSFLNLPSPDPPPLQQQQQQQQQHMVRPASPVPPLPLDEDDDEEENFDGKAMRSDDSRVCVLCKTCGEEDPRLERLLPLGGDEWVHANCALWSPVAQMSDEGVLSQLGDVLGYARVRFCSLCRKPGASVPCSFSGCACVYHLHCAVRAACVAVFLDGMPVLRCPHHAPGVTTPRGLFSPGAVRMPVIASETAFDGTKKPRLTSLPIRIGGLIVLSLGKPEPPVAVSIALRRVQRPPTVESLHIGWESIRFFWDFRNPYKKARYLCQVFPSPLATVLGRPLLKVSLIDENGSAVAVVFGVNASDIWNRIVALINVGRAPADRVFPIAGERHFGFWNPWVVAATAQRSKAASQAPSREPPQPPSNPSGCARTEGYFKWKEQKQGAAAALAMPSSAVASSRPKGPAMATTGSSSLAHAFDDCEVPASLRFRQIAQMQSQLRVGRSRIEGLGVFSTARIPAGTMLLEYRGEIVRTGVCDIREMRYTRQGIGDYQFSLSDGTVLDATMRGSIARFVNHSCSPNCETKIVNVGGKKHVVIMSKTEIQPGDELAYDYLFPLESDSRHRVPCNCGSPACKHWMN